MKKLAGVQFVYNAIEQDYCMLESIRSMMQVCDMVYVVEAGSTDETQRYLMQLAKYNEGSKQITAIFCGHGEWDKHDGPTKLSTFVNLAIDCAQRAGYEYILYVQADEVIHEDSYANIRAAVEEGKEAYVFSRYNLFKDPYHMINVEQSRKPCSTEVIRLAKSCYRAYSDGEHLAVPSCEPYKGDLSSIEMFHLGYVRDPKKHLVKIRHMLVDVFKMGMDTRAENCEEFQWDRFFSEEDLIPIPKRLPIFLQEWAKERYPQS